MDSTTLPGRDRHAHRRHEGRRRRKLPVPCRGGSTLGERLLFLYDENGREARPAERAEAETLFREGLLERCSLPAEEVFFPDELEDLERMLLSAAKKEEEEEK